MRAALAHRPWSTCECRAFCGPMFSDSGSCVSILRLQPWQSAASTRNRSGIPVFSAICAHRRSRSFTQNHAQVVARWLGLAGFAAEVRHAARKAVTLQPMRAFKARVRQGRIVLDEPTNLPEGAEVRLLAVDGDDLDEDERRELDAAIAAAERELDAGHAVTEDQLWARLRAIP